MSGDEKQDKIHEKKTVGIYDPGALTKLASGAAQWKITFPDNTHCRGKDQCTSGLQFNKIGLDQRWKYVVCMNVPSEAVEYKLVKLENSRTLILSRWSSLVFPLPNTKYESINFKVFSRKWKIINKSTMLGRWNVANFINFDFSGTGIDFCWKQRYQI